MCTHRSHRCVQSYMNIMLCCLKCQFVLLYSRERMGRKSDFLQLSEVKKFKWQSQQRRKRWFFFFLLLPCWNLNLALVLSSGKVLLTQFRDTSSALWGAHAQSSAHCGDLAAPGGCQSTKGQHTQGSRNSQPHIPELLCAHQRRSRTKLSISFAQTEMGEGFSRLPKLAAEGSSSSREQILTHFHHGSSCQDGWACSDTAQKSIGGADPLLRRTL